MKNMLSIDTIHAAAVADDQHGLATEATESVFGQLAESTIGAKTRESWEDDIRKIEIEYAEKVFMNTDGSLKDPSARTAGRGKPGDKNYVEPRWKFRTILPVAWSTSKSVCGQAIEHGIKLDNESRKTATEKLIKEARDALKPEKSPREKFKIAMDTAQKVLAQLSPADRKKMLVQYGIDPTKTEFDWGV